MRIEEEGERGGEEKRGDRRDDKFRFHIFTLGNLHHVFILSFWLGGIRREVDEGEMTRERKGDIREGINLNFRFLHWATSGF